MLHNAPSNRADHDSPIRDNEYEYINADDDSPFAISGDGLISLVYAVNSDYRANGTFVMNSATAAAVRKLKMTDRYLWTDSLAAGQPATLLGYPVQIWEQFDDIDVTGGAAATFPIAFGDFRRAYVLCDRTQMRVTVDSSITSPGYTKYYIRRREGGHPYNVNAVKFLRTAA
jgi:HK97 family phage major capsid protein